MHDEGSVLQVIVVFLLAAVLVVPLAKRLQLGAVLGYLTAGVLIGPSMTGLIANPESVSHISELGVVLLLFIIGLELSPRRLWVMRKAVFGAGMAQVVLTGVIIGAVAWQVFAQPLKTSVVLGLGLALSSTAFGLQLLAERKELTSPHGRLAFAILLFQDIAAIPLIAMIPLLSGANAGSGIDTMQLLKVVGSIGLVIVGGRYLLRPIFRIVAKTGLQEVSTATALLVVIGTAWLMELAGISMALGAFLAGLLLADSEYRHELESQIQPFKGLLLGLFFISVGMSADISLLITQPLTVMGLTLILILLKMPVLLMVGKFIGGLNKQSPLRLAIVLAAGGEFAFVVFKMARQQGLFEPALYDLLILTITLSMALTPLMILLAVRMFREKPTEKEVPDEYKNMAIDIDSPRVVIAGVGRMGQIVARILRAQNIPFIALDTAVETIELSRSLGGQMPIFYGDPLRPEILRAAQTEHAEYFIAAMDDPDTNFRAVELVHRLYPKVKVIARARSRSHVYRLIDAGAKPVRETFYSSLEMSRLTLLGLGIEEELANRLIRRFQEHDEQVLEAQHRVHGNSEAVIQTAREARAELQTLFQADSDDAKTNS
ncbi:monovalent cation:proton antiporter-2 (CPA2) family protein [Pseudomonas sp. M30-35]|uniref:monovalent cation:proton antiporter-2 (CPA2) family protein n=1 Tax=Pseudomonas sp. M30-35 TaxID=1981174 RepID=UPI000B3CA25D|nr:monovalent cation:proton antiporter-2 (CPA2) family protein [Pseudomonas sp. M30-35]ARU89425.1 glutathione-regulated potassium-efflux system protein KefB [Pseudomonas sp. M30-35]